MIFHKKKKLILEQEISVSENNCPVFIDNHIVVYTHRTIVFHYISQWWVKMTTVYKTDWNGARTGQSVLLIDLTTFSDW